MKWRILGVLLIIFSLLTTLAVTYINSDKRASLPVFSRNALLDETWNNYKSEYLYFEEGKARTLDKQALSVTTSEGQSYTLLRSVWQSDKETFDSTFAWTIQALARPNDSLFAWKFGQKADGSYGILTDEGGNNAASDADTDIALALLLAYGKWGDQMYLDSAKKIIQDIWEYEVVIIDGKPVIAANNLEKFSTSADIIINPSYFAPYAYRIFAKYDKDHDWNALVTSSYEILNKSIDSNLDKEMSALLVPDWVSVHRNTGEVSATTISNLTTNYSYDAMRTAWRLALDWVWFQEQKAQETLRKMSFLEQQWEMKNTLAPVYGHDGVVLAEYESPAMYGTSIGFFLATNSVYTSELYETKLKSLYSSDKQGWKETLSYYDDNWAWFGIALYNNRILNFSI